MNYNYAKCAKYQVLFFAKYFLQVSSICLILAFLFSSKGKSNQSTYIFLYKKPLYYVHLNGKKVCPQGTICIASSIVSDTNFMPTWQCGKEDMILFFLWNWYVRLRFFQYLSIFKRSVLSNFLSYILVDCWLFCNSILKFHMFLFHKHLVELNICFDFENL